MRPHQILQENHKENRVDKDEGPLKEGLNRQCTVILFEEAGLGEALIDRAQKDVLGQIRIVHIRGTNRQKEEAVDKNEEEVTYEEEKNREEHHRRVLRLV